MSEAVQGVLPDFEGQRVVGARIRITGAGEGLSQSLDVEPEAMHYGETRFFIVETKIGQINHRPKDKNSPDLLIREHTAVTLNVAAVDEDLAKRLLEEAAVELAEKQRKLKEARGEYELGFGGGEGDEAPVDGEYMTPPGDAPGETAEGYQAASAALGGQADSGSWEYPEPDPQPEVQKAQEPAPKRPRRARGSNLRSVDNG